MIAVTPPHELGSLRSGVLAAEQAGRLQELVVRLESNIAAVRTRGPELPPLERARALRADLAAGLVAAIDGVVHYAPASAFETATWRFEGPAPGTLCFADTICCRPLPGTYRLYVLWQSGLVAGLEPHPGYDPVAAHRARLLAVQGVTEGVMLQLQSGQIPDLVRARIASGAGMTRTWAWLATAAVPLTILMAFLVGTIDPSHAILQAGDTAVSWALVFVPFVAYMAMHLHRRASQLARERDAEVLVVEGALDKGWMGATSRDRRPFLELGGEHFDAKSQPFVRELSGELVPGAPYRGYLTSNQRILFLVEPLPAPPTALRRG